MHLCREMRKLPFVKKEANCFDNDRNVPKKIFVATKNVKFIGK